jgi:hypothetical protein
MDHAVFETNAQTLRALKTETSTIRHEKVGSKYMRPLIASFVLTLFLVIVTAGQDRKTVTVGNATAARGQKVTGTIEVPPGVDAGLSIPVVVIHGAKPGPVLALVAGSHGTEYTSIIALEKLIAMLNPAEISGTVIIVPLINIPSFEQKVPHVNTHTLIHRFASLRGSILNEN